MYTECSQFPIMIISVESVRSPHMFLLSTLYPTFYCGSSRTKVRLFLFFSPFFQVKQEFSANTEGISGADTSADSAGGTVIPPVQPVSRQSAEPVQSAATAPRNGRTLCAPAVNIDRYPFFSASLPPIPPRQPKGKEDDSQEGGNRRFLPSCAPAAQASTAVTCGTAFR